MEDSKRSPEELVANLCLDPGFVLVPQDRYEELIRAETERDVLEATICGKNKFTVDMVMESIKTARWRIPGYVPEKRCEDNAEQNHSDGAPDTRPGTPEHPERATGCVVCSGR